MTKNAIFVYIWFWRERGRIKLEFGEWARILESFGRDKRTRGCNEEEENKKMRIRERKKRAIVGHSDIPCVKRTKRLTNNRKKYQCFLEGGTKGAGRDENERKEKKKRKKKRETKRKTETETENAS